MNNTRKTRWHRLLGRVLEEWLTPLDITVLTEVPVITEPPRADIILLRRQGNQWTTEQKSRLADGLRDTEARELLIEFKYAESLDEDAVLQTLVYDRLYLQNQKLARQDLQSFLISASTPDSGILARLGFKPLEQNGVYATPLPVLRMLRIILLNELADTAHNAVFKCFASRRNEQKKAFDAIHAVQWSTPLGRVIFGLRRILMREAVMTNPDEGWTPEDMMRLGQEWMDSLLDAIPSEELFKRPGLIQVLERHKIDGIQIGEQRGEQKGRQEGIQIGEQKGRRDEAALVLRRLLQRRFGSLPAWATAQMAQADLALLEEWTDRVLDAQTLQEVLAASA